MEGGNRKIKFYVGLAILLLFVAVIADLHIMESRIQRNCYELDVDAKAAVYHSRLELDISRSHLVSPFIGLMPSSISNGPIDDYHQWLRGNYHETLDGYRFEDCDEDKCIKCKALSDWHEI